MPVCGALAAGISSDQSIIHTECSGCIANASDVSRPHEIHSIILCLVLVIKLSERHAAFCGLRRGSLPGVKNVAEISIWKVSCASTMDKPADSAEPAAEPESGMMKLWLFSSMTDSQLLIFTCSSH